MDQPISWEINDLRAIRFREPKGFSGYVYIWPIRHLGIWPFHLSIGHLAIFRSSPNKSRSTGERPNGKWRNSAVSPFPWSWYWVAGLWPENATEVMQGDADAPPVRRRPQEEDADHREHDESDRVMRAENAEINKDDDEEHRKAVEDDRERPCVALVAFVNETAHGTSVQMIPPAREERSFTAVRTPFAQAARERGLDDVWRSFDGQVAFLNSGPEQLGAQKDVARSAPGARDAIDGDRQRRQIWSGSGGKLEEEAAGVCHAEPVWTVRI